jgi:uncharacterized protein YutE (UPF0331/DUF86 family)
MDSARDELVRAQASALTALLQRVGYAIWQSAECEDALAIWVVIALRCSRGMGEETAAPILEAAQRQTLGQLLRQLETNETLEPWLLTRLKKLIDERNWLVHHAKRQNRGVLNNLDQFDDLVKRIDWIAEEATALQSILGRKLEEFVVSAGVDPEEIDQQAESLQREWGCDL